MVYASAPPVKVTPVVEEDVGAASAGKVTGPRGADCTCASPIRLGNEAYRDAERTRRAKFAAPPSSSGEQREISVPTGC